MADRPRRSGDTDGFRPEDREAEHGPPVPLYDSAAMARIIGDGDDDYFSPEDERSLVEPPRDTKEEVRADRLGRILRDPRGATRSTLLGTPLTASQLAKATASMPHFREVARIVERGVRQSHHSGLPLTMPPILMASEPGLGKTFYYRMVAQALRTTCIPIAINGISDRGGLGGLSSAWRGAKPGKFAHGSSSRASRRGRRTSWTRSASRRRSSPARTRSTCCSRRWEPENARASVDEYIDILVDLRFALWLASANDFSAMPAALLDRMLVIDVPWPDPASARVAAEAVAAEELENRGFEVVADGALKLICISRPAACAVFQLACGFAAEQRRLAVTREDVIEALDLVVRDRRRRVGFLAASAVVR